MHRLMNWSAALCCALAGAAASAAVITEVRSATGVGNNLEHPLWGSVFTPNLRGPSGSDYADGISALAGQDRPSPREVSNALFSQPQFTPDPIGRSDFVWAWAQFVDHELALVLEQQFPPELAPIPIPAGDPMFDPESGGGKTMFFERSSSFLVDDIGSPREHGNVCSAYFDGSHIYGIEDLRQVLLRSFSGGRLATSESDFGTMMPYNLFNQPNAKDPFGTKTNHFFAGDPRANEHLVLASMHTLFLREHNWWADRLHAENPAWDDETIYQMARKIVAAEFAIITYRDFLPVLIGDRVPEYSGYKPGVNPGLQQAFATAAYRLGHTMIESLALRLNEDGSESEWGHVSIRDAFFKPQQLTQEGGIEPVLRGLVAQVQQQVDLAVIDDLRNFLFKNLHGNQEFIPLDLVSLNIQRGRDHGVQDYNDIRADYGLAKHTSIAQVTEKADVVSKLTALYGGDVDNIDLFAGVLAEDPVEGSVLGELGTAVLVDQFTRSRDGDRFWYANDPDLLQFPALIEELEAITARDIVLRNTTIQSFPDNPFFACTLPGDIDKNRTINSADLNFILANFGQAADPGKSGDIDGTGFVDSADLNLVLSVFGRSCE